MKIKLTEPQAKTALFSLMATLPPGTTRREARIFWGKSFLAAINAEKALKGALRLTKTEDPPSLPLPFMEETRDGIL